jgi:glycerol uptake facilitator-like aquaporin
VRGIFIEAILTAELVFTIFVLAKEKHSGTFYCPRRYGASTVHCRVSWSLLHWWISEPLEIVWALRRHWYI